MSQKILHTNETFKKLEKILYIIVLFFLIVIFLLFFKGRLKRILSQNYKNNMKHKYTKRNIYNSVIQN